MRLKILLGASALVLAFMAPAFAGQDAGNAASPAFSPEDVRIIQRNAALASLVDSDPSTVRHVLDLIAAAKRDKSGHASQSGSGRQADGKRPPAPDGIDLQKNPELEELDRSSPEAAFDLFRLLKQAGSKGPGTQSR